MTSNRRIYRTLSGAMSAVVRSLIICVTCGIASMMIAGCETAKPTTQPSSATDRQNAALRDPMHYSPGMDNPDISGGGIGDFHGDSMRRDINDVLNP